MPRKTGAFTPNANMTKSGNDYGFLVNRYTSDEADDSYHKLLASNYPWMDTDEQVGSVTEVQEKLASNYTGVELVKMGFEIQGHYKVAEQAEAEKIIYEKQYNRQAHIVIAGNSKQPIFEMWVPRKTEAEDNMITPGFGKSAGWNIAEGKGVVKVATKTVKYNVPDSITKIAWNDAIRLGFVNDLEYLGFNKYQSKGRKGVWWKQRVVDPDTGEDKEYLVRENQIDHATDTGAMKVEGVKKMAKRVIKKVASTDKADKEEQQTSASKSSGIDTLVVDLDGTGWKKEIDDYLKEVKDNQIIAKKMEVKIVDWEPIENDPKDVS
jgi:hypothetical protein